MIGLWINPAPKVKRPTVHVVRPVHPSSIGKDMRQSAFGAEFAVALDEIRPRMFGLYGMEEDNES